MGREVLYVVDTGIGYVRVLEQGSAAAYAIGAEVRIGFSAENSLVFDSADGKRLDGAKVAPPS
jgi:inositol-phosphate transport system ATP-binding protein